MYKCAIVAVGGGRANGHADAYAHIERGELAAISTRRREKLDELGEKWGVRARYTDYREMFDKEKPDLVHVNTPPNVRLEVFEAAEAASVPALIVEKPLAIGGEDFRAIESFSKSARTKIAINHQLHFHPRRQALQDTVRSGKIGDVRFIEASCRMNLALQGTHALQAISAFHPDGVPAWAFGQVSGADGLQDTPKKHFAPDECQAIIGYADGLCAHLQSGSHAPKVGDPDRINLHKRIAVYGTRGFVHWTMSSWEVGIEGKVEGWEAPIHGRGYPGPGRDDRSHVRLARGRRECAPPESGCGPARIQRCFGYLHKRTREPGGRPACRTGGRAGPQGS